MICDIRRPDLARLTCIFTGFKQDGSFALIAEIPDYPRKQGDKNYSYNYN